MGSALFWHWVRFSNISSIWYERLLHYFGSFCILFLFHPRISSGLYQFPQFSGLPLLQSILDYDYLSNLPHQTLAEVPHISEHMRPQEMDG
jgi:hypothetical protein